LIEGSFEARFSLTSNLRLAVFADFGQVTRGRLQPEDVRTLLWAVGIGIRYLTPVGPIRLDIARRFQVGRPPPLFALDAMTGAITQVDYEVDDSCFGLGGTGRVTPVRDNLCVLHLSIGEAF
jgi:translocation and assembly module TamA